MSLLRKIKCKHKEESMKKIVVIAVALVMVLCIGIGSASAENSLKQGTIGMNVDVTDNFVLTGKYLIMNDLAILADFGIGVKGDDGKGTDIGIGGGVRKYLKMDDFAPFVSGTLFYSETDDGDSKNLSILGDFGAEYFLHKQFSIEGRVAFGYTRQETTTSTPGFIGTVPVTTSKTTTVSTFGTDRATISFNFYF
jgi:hypothetical protein